MTVLALLALVAWVYLLLAHGRFWSAGPSLSPSVPNWAPDLDIVVPARDEAEGIERCLRSLLAQEYAGAVRIVLVDDGSTDGTGDIARRLECDRLRVVTGAPRPPGWSGKLWAVSQGVAQGSAPLVLLCDADIVHDPAHAATLVEKLGTGLDLVSEMVALNCESFAERALVPAFVFFFQLLYPFARANDARSRTAAAAGGTILVRRAALDRIGGIAAVRGALIDDVALARAVKRTGGGIWLGHSRLARSIRPYPGAADVWRMVARTAYVQLRFSPVILAGTLAGLALVWLVPPAAALFGTGLARWAGLLAWVGATASYLPTLRRFRLSPPWALGLPLVACFYMAATVGSAVDHHRGRGVVWKRRAYGEAGA